MLGIRTRASKLVGAEYSTECQLFVVTKTRATSSEREMNAKNYSVILFTQVLLNFGPNFVQFSVHFLNGKLKVAVSVK